MMSENNNASNDIRNTTGQQAQTQQQQSGVNEAKIEKVQDDNAVKYTDTSNASTVPNDVSYSNNVHDPKMDIRNQMNEQDNNEEAQEAASDKPKDTSLVRYDNNGNKSANWADAMINGVTAQGASDANLESGFFLPDDEGIKKTLKEKGVKDEHIPSLVDNIKNEYKNLKNGVYKGKNIKDGYYTNAQFNDNMFGKNYAEQIQDDLFYSHQIGSSGSMKYANVYSYLDDTYKMVKNPRTGEMEKVRLSGSDRIWNPNLVVDNKLDANGVPTGEFYIREMEKGETRIGKHMLPSWNNPKVYGLDWYEMPAAFVSGVVPKTVETIGSILEMAYELPTIGSNGWAEANTFTKVLGVAKTGLLGFFTAGIGNLAGYGMDMVEDDLGYDPIANGLDYIIRGSQRLQWKASDSIAEGGFTGTASSFMFSLSQGLGEFVPQIALASLSGGASLAATVGEKATMAMGRQLLTSQALKSSTKRVVRKGLDAYSKQAAGKALTKVEQAAIKSYDKVAKKYAGESFFNKNAEAAITKAINTSFGQTANKYALAGTAQAMGGNYNEMIANGISQQDAAAMSIAMAPIVYATERIVGTKWLEGKLGVTQINRAVKKDLDKHFGEVVEGGTKAAAESIGNVAKNNKTKLKSMAGVKDTNKRFGMKMLKGMADDLGQSVKNIRKDISNSMKGNTSAPANSNIAKTFGLALTALDKLEDVYDTIKFTRGYFNPGSMMKAMLSEGVQETLEDSAYISAYYLHDNFLAKDGAVKGDGAMGYFSWSRDVMSADTFHQLTESFIGGAAIGGFAAGVMRQRSNRYGDDVLSVESAINGDTEKVADAIAESWRNEPQRFGSTEHSPDLQVLNKNGKDKTWIKVDRDYSKYGLEEGQELKSVAEVNYFNYLNNLFDTKRMYDETGLGKEALKNFAGAHSILYRGLNVFKQQKERAAENAEIDKQLKDPELPAEEKQKLEQQKAINENIIEAAKKEYKYLMQDEIASIAEDKIAITEKMNKLRKEKAKDLEDPTSRASFEMIEEQRKFKELNKHLAKIKKTKSKGYSRAYKDNIKNSVATLMLANEYAVNELLKDASFKKKYGKGTTEYDQKDVDKFLSLRSEWMAKYKGENFYKDSTSMYEQMVQAAYLEREKHKAIVEKGQLDLDKEEDYTSKVEEFSAELNNISKELDNIPEIAGMSDPTKSFKDNATTDEYSIYQRNQLLGRLSTAVDSIVEFAGKNRAKEGIIEIMQGFQKQIDSTAKALNIDNKWMEKNAEQLNIRKFFEIKGEDGSVRYQPRDIQEGEDASDAISVLSVVSDVMSASSQIEGQAGDLTRDIDSYQKSLKFVNSKLKTNVNEMYGRGASSLIAELDKIKESDDDNQDLEGYEGEINHALKLLDQLENSVKVRAFSIAPMQVTEESKFLDRTSDVPMDVATAKVLLKMIKEQRAALKAHLEIIQNKIGLRSNYFIRMQHTEAIMKRNFLIGFLENKVLDTLGIPGLESIRKSFEQISIPVFDPNATEYSDDDAKALNSADSELNKIYDQLALHSDKIGKRDVLEKILRDVYLDSVDHEGGEFLSYMKSTSYRMFSKNEYWEDISSKTKDDSFGEYSSYSGRTPYYYKHFVNQLVIIASGNKISDLASHRLAIYPNIKIHSSIEQINAENELLSFINGGSEIIDMISNPTNGIELNYMPENLREQISSKYHSGIAALNGDAQTGKSVQIVPQSILLQERINPREKYILVAHSAETLRNFNELEAYLVALNPNLKGKIEIRSHLELKTKGLESSLDNSLIFIDEASLLNNQNIIDLENSYTKGKQNKIVFVGDESQMTQFIGDDAVSENLIFSSGFITTALTKKYATDNPYLEGLMNVARHSYNTHGNDYPPAWSEVMDGSRRGVEYYEDELSIARAFLNRAKKGQDSDAALVFLSKAHYDDFISSNPELKKDLEEYSSKISYLGESSKTPPSQSKSIQGGRREQIYNMFDGTEEQFQKYSDVSDNINILTGNAIYTILSRSKSFIATIGDTSNKASKRPTNFAVNAEPINNEGITDYLRNVMNGTDGAEAAGALDVDNEEDLSDKAKDVIKKIDGIRSQADIVDPHKKSADGSIVYDIMFSNGEAAELKHNTSVVATTTKNINDMLKDNMDKEDLMTLDQLSNREHYGNKGNAVDALWRDVLSSNNTSFIKEDGTPDMDMLWEKHKKAKSSELYKWVQDPKNGEYKRELISDTLWPNQKTFETYVNLLFDYRKELEKDYYIITETVLLYHKGIEIGGVPDMILVNKKTGDVEIRDLKVKYVDSYTDKNGRVKYDFSIRKYYTYTDDNGDIVELTDHDKYSYQVNGYRELFQEMLELNSPIKMEINVVLTGNTNKFAGNTPFIGPASPAKGESEVAINRFPVKSFKTNIGEAIDAYNASIVNKERDHSTYTFPDGTEVNRDDQVTPVFNSAEIFTVERIFDINDEYFIELSDGKRNFLITPLEYYQDYIGVQVYNNIPDNSNTLNPSDSHTYSAKLFENNKGGIFYANTESVLASRKELESVGVTEIKHLQLVKNIKAKLHGKLPLKMVWRRDFEAIGDNFGKGEFKSGIFGVVDLTEDQLIKEIYNNKANFTPDELDLLRSITKNKAITASIFGNAVTLGLPRVYDPTMTGKMKFRPIEITKLDDVQKVIDQINNTKIPSSVLNKQDAEHVKNYNIALVKLFGKALLEADKINGKEVTLAKRMPNAAVNRNVTAVYGGKQLPLSKLMENSAAKGYTFDKEIQKGSFTSVATNKGNKRRLRVGFTFQKEFDVFHIDVFTPKFKSRVKQATGLKKYYIKELEDYINTMQAKIDSGNIFDNENSSNVRRNNDIVLELLKNFTSKFTDASEIKNFRTPDGKLLSDIIFLDGDSKFASFAGIERKKYKNGNIKTSYNISVKDEYKNRISFAKFLIDEFNKPKLLADSYLPIRFGRTPTDLLLTNVTEIFRPHSMLATPGVNFDNVINEINEYKKGAVNKGGGNPPPKPPPTPGKGFGFRRMIYSRSRGKLVDVSATKEEALGIVEKILGASYDPNWVGFELNFKHDGINLWGSMIAGRIKLRVNKKGLTNRVAIRHEIFHVVDDFYLSSNTQQRIYSLVESNVPEMKNATEDEIKEWLADWYGVHGKSYGEMDVEKIDEKYLAKFGILLEGVNDRYLEFHRELASLFHDIENGKYADQIEKLPDYNDKSEVSKYKRIYKPDEILALRERTRKFKSKVDRTKKRKGRLLTDMDDGELNDMIASRLREVFGNDKEIVNAANILSAMLFQETGFGGGEMVLTKAIRTIGNPTRQGVDHIFFRKLDSSVDISKINANNLSEATDEEYMEYVKDFIVNDWMIAKGLLNVKFPDYSFVDGRLYGKAASTIQDDNSNPSLNTSSTIRWINETVPYTFEGVAPNNRDSSSNYYFVSPQEVNNIMQKANEAVIARLSRGDQYTIREYIDAVEASLEIMRPHDGSRKDQIIYSIQKHFFKGTYDGDYIDQVPVSGGQIKDGVAKTVLSRETDLEKDVSNMMIAYFTKYRNEVKVNFLSQKIDYDKNPRTTMLNVDDINTYKLMITDKITSELFLNGRVNPKVKSMFKKKLDWNDEDSDSYITVSNGKIKIGYHEVLQFDKATGTWDFIEGKFNLKYFNDLKSFTGISTANEKLFNVLRDNDAPFEDLSIADVSKIKDANLMTPRQLFATIAANYAETIQMNVEIENFIDELTEKYDEDYTDKWSDNDKLISRFNAEVKNHIDNKLDNVSESLKTFMEKIHFNKSYIKDTFALTNGTDEIVSINDVNILKPQDFFTYNEVIAEIMYNQLDFGKTQFAYLGGKKFTVYSIMNNILNSFPTAKETSPGSGIYSNVVNDKVTNELNKQGDKLDDKEIVTVSISGNKAVSNSIFSSDKKYDKTLKRWVDASNNSLANVRDVSKIVMLQGPYNSTQKMNRRDNALSIFSTWIDSVSSGVPNSAKVLIGFTSDDYYANIEFKNNIISIVRDSENNIVKVNANPEALAELFERNAMMYEKVMQNSFNRLKSFFEQKNIKKFMESNPVINEMFSKEFDINNESLDKLSEFSVQLSQEMIDVLKNSGLYKIADYTIDDDGVFRFGNEVSNPVPGSDFYTRENIAQILKNPSYETILKLSGDTIRFNNNMLTETIGDRNGVNVFGIKEWWEKNQPEGFEATSSFSAKEKGKGDNAKTIYNPIFTTYALMELAVAPSFNSFIAGTEGQYKHSVDYGKRFDTNNTPVQRVLDGVPGGLADQFDVYIYESLTVTHEFVGEESTMASNDGGSYGFTPFQILLNTSLGSEHSRIKKGILKPLSVGTNGLNARNLIIKYAMDFHDDFMLANSPELMTIQNNLMKLWNKKAQERLIEKFGDKVFIKSLDLEKLSETYQNKYSSYTKAMTALVQDLTNPDSSIYTDAKGDPIIDAEFQDDVIKEIIRSVPMGVVPSDSIKSGAKHIATEDPSAEINLGTWNPNTIETSNYGLINDYNHHIDKRSSLTAPNQFFGHASGDENVESIMQSLDSIINMNIIDFYDSIGIGFDPTQWNDREVQTFRNSLRELGIQNASSNQGNIGLMETLLKGGHIDGVQIAKKLEQYQSSRFNKMIQPKFHGSRYIQSSAEYLAYYVHRETGVRYNLTTLKSLFTEDEIAKDFVKTKYNHMQVKDGKHVNSDIAANFMYAEMFGLEKGEQPEHGFMITFDDTTDFINFEDLLDTHEGDKQALAEAIKKRIEDKGMQGKLILEGNTPFARTQRRFMADEEILALDDDMILRLTDYLYNYHESLKVVLNRIPFDSPSLGFTGRIRQFVWDNGSSVYIAPFDNKRTGGDYDIDELSIYYRGFKNAFDKFEGEEKEGHLNNIVDSIFDFYSDLNNKEILYKETGVDKIKKDLDDVQEEIDKEDDRHWYQKQIRMFHSPMGINNMKAHVVAGDSAIDIFAAGISAFAYLHQTKSVFMKGSDKLSDKEYIDRMGILSGLLQSSLDNKKELILGRFNVPGSAMNILFGMAANGLDNKAIYRAVNNRTAQDLFKMVEAGEDLLESKQHVAVLVGKFIDNVHNNVLEAALHFSLEPEGRPLKGKEKALREAALIILSSKGTQSELDNLNLTEEEKTKLKGKTDADILAAEKVFRKYGNSLFTETLNYKKKMKDKNLTEDEMNSLKTELMILEKNIKQANALGWKTANLESLKTIREAAVTGETLRQLGQVVRLRNGVPSNHSEMVLAYRGLGKVLGSDVFDLIEAPEPISNEEKLEYYLANDNYYRSQEPENRKIIEEFAKDVFDKIDIRGMVLNQPYFKTLILGINNHYQSMKQAFFINSQEIEDIEFSYFSDQNRVGSQYANQLAVFSKFASGVMINEFFKHNYNEPFSLSIPVEKTIPGKTANEEGYNTYVNAQNELSEIKLTNKKGTRMFVKHFPILIRAMQDFISNRPSNSEIVSFFKAANILITEEEINDFNDFSFFESIHIVGYGGAEYIQLDPNINTSDAGVMEANRAFKSLPKGLRTLFEIYNTLHLKGAYQQNGLSEVITTDLAVRMGNYYSKNRIDSLKEAIIDSTIRNDVHNHLGLDANLRRPFNPKKQVYDPARNVTVTKKYGLFKSKRPAIVTGAKNESDKLIHISNVSASHMTAYYIGDVNTIPGAEVVKIPTIQELDFFKMIKGTLKDDFIIEFAKPVGYKETSFDDFIYVTDHGYLVRLTKPASNMIELSISEKDTVQKILDDAIERYSLMLSMLPSPGRANKMIENDEDFIAMTYDSIDIARKKSKFGEKMFGDFGDRIFLTGNDKIGYYKVNVLPMEREMTNSEIKQYLKDNGVAEADYERVLGFEGMKGKRLLEYRSWFNNKNDKTTRYFIVIKKGELVSNTDWTIQYAKELDATAKKNSCK